MKVAIVAIKAGEAEPDSPSLHPMADWGGWLGGFFLLCRRATNLHLSPRIGAKGCHQ